MTCKPLSAETAEFVELIKEFTPVQLRVLNGLIYLLKCVPMSESTPLEQERYLRTLLIVMRDDMFRGETEQAERDIIAKHLATTERLIAELEGSQP